MENEHDQLVKRVDRLKRKVNKSTFLINLHYVAQYTDLSNYPC